MITDEQISDYMNDYYMECAIRQSEENLLYLLKLDYERKLCDQKNELWKEFSDFFIKRRSLKE